MPDAQDQLDGIDLDGLPAGVDLDPEAPGLLARLASTLGCVLVAALFVPLQQIVARAAAGAGLGLLVLLFSELTLAVACAALVGIVAIWFPDSLRSASLSADMWP